MLIGCLMQLYVGTFHVVSAEIAVTMGVPIENPVDCEVWGVIRFLQENVRPCDIHCRLVIIYGKGIILSCHRSHARFKQTASTQKLTASYSKTVKGVLLINFMPHNMKINSNAYCATLEHLCRAIQNQWRGKLSHGIPLLHDNACLHTAWHTQALLHEQFHWDIFEHPPYSLHLALSDFFLFSKMKEHLAGKCYANDEDPKNAVVTLLNNQVATWYEEGIHKLVP